jgi:hypothetical protein
MHHPTNTIVIQPVVPALALGLVLTFPIPIHQGLVIILLTTPAANHLCILVQRIIDPCTCHIFILVTLGLHSLIRMLIKQPCCLSSDRCQHSYPPCKMSKGNYLPGSTRWRSESMPSRTPLRMKLKLEVVLRRWLQGQGVVQASIHQLR